MFSGSLCSSMVVHRFSLYPNLILSHSWINILLFRMESCSSESRLGCYFSLVYNNLYEFLLFIADIFQDSKWMPKSTKSCSHHIFPTYIYYYILKPLNKRCLTRIAVTVDLLNKMAMTSSWAGRQWIHLQKVDSCPGMWWCRNACECILLHTI